MKQRTIRQAVAIDGVGLHTGAYVNLSFHPAPDDHGIKFQRTDLEGEPVFNVDVSIVCSTDRSTTLQVNEAGVSTVEHVLSALAGLEIDNVLIQIDGPEVPILDGSALPLSTSSARRTSRNSRPIATTSWWKNPLPSATRKQDPNWWPCPTTDSRWWP